MDSEKFLLYFQCFMNKENNTFDYDLFLKNLQLLVQCQSGVLILEKELESIDIMIVFNLIFKHLIK